MWRRKSKRRQRLPAGRAAAGGAAGRALCVQHVQPSIFRDHRAGRPQSPHRPRRCAAIALALNPQLHMLKPIRPDALFCRLFCLQAVCTASLPWPSQCCSIQARVPVLTGWPVAVVKRHTKHTRFCGRRHCGRDGMPGGRACVCRRHDCRQPSPAVRMACCSYRFLVSRTLESACLQE